MDRRSYNQYCGLAKALDIVGERWTLLIVRNLLLGPQRYSDLLRGLPGITTNLLAKRLKEMEELGLLERVQTSGSDGAQGYRLTELGAGLEPAVHALSRWAWQHMGAPARGEHRSFDNLLVALRRRYRGGTSLRAEIVADGAPYRIILTEAHADISRGDVRAPALRLRGPGAVLARLFLDEKARKRLPPEVEVEGGAAALRSLLDAFAISDVSATLADSVTD